MPIADSRGVPIHYETEGQGPPLVLYHGFCGTLIDWYDFGYVASLRDSYQLVLMDARGHGTSGKPHKSQAYETACQAGDVIVVLDDMGIERAHYFGYSMGGRVGYAMASSAPERLSSLTIGGIHAYPQNPKGIQKRIATWKRGLEMIVPFMAQGYQDRWTSAQEERFLANDVDALIAYLAALPSYDYSAFLPHITVPSLLYAGIEDTVFYEGMRRGAAEIPRASFVSLSGLDHYGAYHRSDIVVPFVMAFIQSVA